MWAILSASLSLACGPKPWLKSRGTMLHGWVLPRVFLKILTRAACPGAWAPLSRALGPSRSLETFPIRFCPLPDVKHVVG